MTPLFNPCTKCSHPAIKAAKQCKTAMILANDGQPTAAEAMLKSAMHGLRRADLPMMKAKILNSLGLVHALQGRHHHADRCLGASLRIISAHIGTDNWLYARIAASREQLNS
jgi:RES domain-containing protein